MGLFGKIKNILFEEEDDIEIPLEEKPEKKKFIEPKREIKQEKKEVEAPVFKEPLVRDEEVPLRRPHLSLDENDLFDKPVSRPPEPVREVVTKPQENSFRFPLDFNENDFKSDSNVEKITTTTKISATKEQSRDFDRYTIKKTEEKVVEKKPFTPTPVISPVYGIMDKNYRKEDIQEKPKSLPLSSEQKRGLDIDRVRDKAFGLIEDDFDREFNSIKDETLEEIPELTERDLELETLSSTSEVSTDGGKELTEPIKSIDELLLGVSSEKEETKVSEKYEKASELNETFKLDEVISELKKTSDNLSTEEDLFNLIDSLYEERED